MSRYSVGPSWIYLPEMHIELLQMEGGFLIFQKKDEAKSFPAEIFSALRTTVPYLLSRVVKISTPVRPHMTLWCNSPEDISRHFADITNVPLPFIRPIFDPIAFEFVIPFQYDAVQYQEVIKKNQSYTKISLK